MVSGKILVISFSASIANTHFVSDPVLDPAP
jgi:hypothetical protein